MSNQNIFKPYTIIKPIKQQIPTRQPNTDSEEFSIIGENETTSFNNNHMNLKLKLISIKYRLGKLFDEHFVSTSASIFKNTLLVQYCIVLAEKFKKDEDKIVITHLRTISEIFMNTGSYTHRSIEEMLLICNNLSLIEHMLYFFTTQ